MNTSDSNEADAEIINQLINCFFSVFDNRDGRQPDFAILDGMFLDQGMIHKRDDSGVESMSLAAFKAPRIELFISGQLQDFHEWETSQKTVIEHSLASRLSSYQKAGLLNGENYQGQGTKHFQLIKTETGWKITAITWEDLG